MNGRTGRPRGRTLQGALLACSGVGGPLGEAGRRVIADLVRRHGRHCRAIAEELGVCERQARRLLSFWGVPKRGGAVTA